jgi:hypothetical protein
MNLLFCGRAREVQDAAVSGRWRPELRGHASSCRSCRDVVASTSMLAEGRTSGPPVSIDPVLLWARAQQVRRFQTEARISRIVTAGQLAAFAAAVGVAGTFVLSANTWPSVPDLAIDRSWLYGAAAVLMVMMPGVSRWMSQDA